MAGGYGCAFDDCPKPVNWLVTRLNPPVTVSLCDDDFPQGIIPMLAAMLGVDPLRLYDAVKRFVDREAAREAKAAELLATPAEIDCPWCGEVIHGTAGDIDSGLRKHQEYCPKAPDDDGQVPE